jgi:hypothetical protein
LAGARGLQPDVRGGAVQRRTQSDGWAGGLGRFAAAAAASPDGESTCIEGTNCDHHGVVSLEAIPPTTALTRPTRIVTSSKSGIRFSRSRSLYAFGATQDGEPNVRVDYQAATT